MREMIGEFIGSSALEGWRCVGRSPGQGQQASLMVAAAGRAAIPSGYLGFLSQFHSLSSEDESRWFLSLEDFAGVSDSAFAWNEFERISVDAAIDEQEAEEIRAFWQEYLPIAMSVAGDYQFIALSRRSGAVVHGVEPEFENVTTLAPSLESLMHDMIEGCRVKLFSD